MKPMLGTSPGRKQNYPHHLPDHIHVHVHQRQPCEPAYIESTMRHTCYPLARLQSFFIIHVGETSLEAFKKAKSTKGQSSNQD